MGKRQHLQFDRMMNYLGFCANEIGRCEKAKAYLAGCVLIGSSTEYFIAVAMRLFPHTVHKSGHQLSERWDLAHLNCFAKSCGWFDTATFNASERIRKTRNVVHPAWVAKSKALPIGASVFRKRYSDFDLVRRRLEHLVV